MLAMLSCAAGAAALPAPQAAAATPAPPLGPSPPPLPAGPLPVPPLTETFISEEGFRFDYPAGWCACRGDGREGSPLSQPLSRRLLRVV